MGQISIILITGLIFLFHFEPPETRMNISDMQVVLWTVVLTGYPILIAYFVTGYVARTFPAHKEENLPKLYRLRRYMIVFECLSLAGYLCNLYLLNLPVLIDKYFAFFPMENLRQMLALFPLLIGHHLYSTYVLPSQSAPIRTLSRSPESPIQVSTFPAAADVHLPHNDRCALLAPILGEGLHC